MRTLALLLIAWGLCGPGWSQAGPKVTWMVADQPPASMPVNGQPTDGVLDVLWKLIVQQWPEAEHQVVVMPTVRAMASLAEGRQACAMGVAITPDREKVAYFSQTHVGIPLQVITRSEVVARLPRNAAGEVLSQPLFDSPELRGILVRDRSYSPSLDAQLRRRSAKSTVSYSVTADGGANIFKMISLRRADYTLDFDFALAYQLKKHPDYFQPLVSVPIANSTPLASGIACPRTPWGRNAIIKIDSIVASLATNRDYQESANRWLTPQTVQRYRKEWEVFFHNRERPTDPQKYLP